MVVRPEVAISPLSLGSLSGGDYLVQPKFNGCFVEVRDGVLFNRHGQRFTKCDSRKLDLSGLNGVIGEFMDNGNFPMYGSLVLFDFPVFGCTIEERLMAMYSILGSGGVRDCMVPELFHPTERENIVTSTSMTRCHLSTAFSAYIRHEHIEGLVLKKRDTKLSIGKLCAGVYKVRKPSNRYRM